IALWYVSPPLTACLFVNPEGSLPKPSISVSPGGVIPMGGNVTIQCWHQRLGMRFLLYKAGDGNYLTYTDPAGSEAEFPITSARREHGGSYTCRYSNRTVRVAYSEPSDPVQIIVAGEGPSPAPRLPGAVTIRCECRCAGTRVLLSKAGDPDARRSMDPAGNVAEFPIRNVSRGDAGNYSCQYSTKSDLSVWSEPSDPVELVVTGEGPGYIWCCPTQPHEGGHKRHSVLGGGWDVPRRLFVLFCILLISRFLINTEPQTSLPPWAPHSPPTWSVCNTWGRWDRSGMG
uniref:Immunoglobulin domain-containing protein n=1 Tax=Chrysemys picta bellii TaxID=8478 RepID=A0A8C3HJC8_CHRPI